MNTELLRSADASDEIEDMSSNQPYNINIELHLCVTAAKLVPEGAAQTAFKLVDFIVAVPVPPPVVAPRVPVPVPAPVVAAGDDQ